MKSLTAQFFNASLHCVLAGGLVLAALPAVAATNDNALGLTKYVQLTGDINGDGLNDVLMKAIPSVFMIPLDDDLSIPIVQPTPAPSFALLSDKFGQYSLLQNPDGSVLSSAAWKSGTHGLTFSGAAGDLAGTVSIAASSSDQRSFVVTLGSSGTLQLADISAPVPKCD